MSGSRRTAFPAGRPIVALAALVMLGGAIAGPAQPLAARTPAARVTLVTLQRPDDDPTTVADAVAGLRRAQADFTGTSVAWMPLRAPSSDPFRVTQEWPAVLGALRSAARASDVVITWGDLLTDPAITVAEEYPRVRFILEDPIFLERLPPNVVESIVWDGEQAFLAGALGAMRTRSGRLGYVGPTLPGWQSNAFRAGAYYVRPEVQVLVDYVATTVTAAGAPGALPASWQTASSAGTSEPGYHEPRKAEEVALAQFDRGADILYIPAGASSVGAYEAALLRRRWVIGQGGPRSLNRMPEAWRARSLATIVEYGDAVVYRLVDTIVAGRRLRPHTVWQMQDVPAQAPLLGVALSASARTGDAPRRLARIMYDLRAGRIDVPYSERQLSTFFKHYAR